MAESEELRAESSMNPTEMFIGAWQANESVDSSFAIDTPS